MRSEDPVVVGMDGSPVAYAALMWAARAADALGRPLLVVLAGDVTDPAELALGSPNPSADLLSGAVAGVRRAGIGCEIDTLLKDEQPAPLLDDLSARAAAIVVGAGTEGRLASLIFGSLSYHLQGHGRCPVVTVPPDWIGRAPVNAPLVVVGIKPSPGGIEALEFAMSYAEATRSHVLAVRCWDRRAVQDGTDPLAERDVQRQLLDGLVREASARHPCVRISTQVTPGPIHDVLRLAGLSADLLVVGTRYATGVRGSRLGPVADRVTRRMPCPVAVVSAPGSTEGPTVQPRRRDLAAARP